jgi:hypothetical protein
MQGADQPAATAVTDEQGRYSLSLETEGLYHLLISPAINSGFANAVVNDLLLGGQPIVQNVVLISGASVLSGTVRDGQGRPISNIGIRILEQESGTEIAWVGSDEYGRYEVALAEGIYNLDVFPYIPGIGCAAA